MTCCSMLAWYTCMFVKTQIYEYYERCNIIKMQNWVDVTLMAFAAHPAENGEA